MRLVVTVDVGVRERERKRGPSLGGHVGGAVGWLVVRPWAVRWGSPLGPGVEVVFAGLEVSSLPGTHTRVYNSNRTCFEEGSAQEGVTYGMVETSIILP